jgi:Flp pilus assembly protein TadD
VGITYSKKGNDTAAIYAFNRAWSIDSTDANTYNLMGNSYFNIGRYKDAQYLYGKSIEYNPSNAVLYGNYGTASQWAGEADVAEEYYKKSLQRDAKYSHAYYLLACLYAAAKPAEAVKNLALAIKYGSYTRADIENDNNLVALKDNKGFKELLTKLK